MDSLRLGTLVGPEMARREEAVDALVDERDSVPLKEKNRRVDDERFGGTKAETGGESGGELGPRRWLSRPSARSHRVQGWVCDSPM